MTFEVTGSWPDWTTRLGGQLDRDDGGGLVIHCPGPGHSPDDRSLAVWIDADAPSGFRVFSFADDDMPQCRDFVRAKVGAPEWKPNGKGNGHDKSKHKGSLTEQYVYENELGLPVLRVSRYANPKSFAQSFPDGAGGWTWGGIPDSRRVPYKLPECIEAAGLGKTIHVTEGEKGALSLWKHGVAATCSNGGACHWPARFAVWFKGADVVILPDNDAQGRKHADQVAKSLEGIAASVRIIHLPGIPVGGDVFDFLQNGGDPHGIVNLRSGPPKKGFTAAELWDMDFPAVSYAVPRYIAEGLTLFAGAPKRGKSWLALDACIAVACGGFVLGDQHCIEGDALYCALEDSPRRIKDRLKRICQLRDSAPHRLTVWFGADLPRLGDGCVEALLGWIESADKPRLIIIDTLNFIRPERTRDEDPYSYDYRTVTTLQQLALVHHIAIVLVHHTRKSAADDYLESISGTNGLTGGSDAVMVLERGQEGAFILKGRGRDIEEFELAMRFDKDACRWLTVDDSPETRMSQTRAAILGIMREAKWFLSVADIVAQTGLKRNVVDQQLFQMAKSGEVIRASRGKYKLPDNVVVFRGGKRDADDDDD